MATRIPKLFCPVLCNYHASTFAAPLPFQCCGLGGNCRQAPGVIAAIICRNSGKHQPVGPWRCACVAHGTGIASDIRKALQKHFKIIAESLRTAKDVGNDAIEYHENRQFLDEYDQ